MAREYSNDALQRFATQGPGAIEWILLASQGDTLANWRAHPLGQAYSSIRVGFVDGITASMPE